MKEQSREKPARMVRPFADVKLQFCFSGLSLSESRGPPSQRRRVYVPSNFPQDATSVQLRFLFYPSLSSPFLFTFQPLNHHFATFSYESWKNSSYELRFGFANNDEEESINANACKTGQHPVHGHDCTLSKRYYTKNSYNSRKETRLG